MSLWIKPPPYLIEHLGKKHPISLRATLQLLNGKTVDTASDTFTWPETSWQGWKHFIDWRQFWLESSENRRDDGFRVVIDINSAPRHLISDPLLLQNVSRLIEGEDIIDTKFWLFSGRFMNMIGTVGADRPLPLYANSEFLACRSDYFATSTCRMSSKCAAYLSNSHPQCSRTRCTWNRYCFRLTNRLQWNTLVVTIIRLTVILDMTLKTRMKIPKEWMQTGTNPTKKKAGKRSLEMMAKFIGAIIEISETMAPTVRDLIWNLSWEPCAFSLLIIAVDSLMIRPSKSFRL
jgi:hypothetical protein